MSESYYHDREVLKMASSSFADMAHTTSPPAYNTSLCQSHNQSQKDNPTSQTNDASATHNDNTVLHAHRQSHNSSKLPTFRFADLMGKKDGLVAPSLLQHIPPSPVSPPNPVPPNATPADSDHQVDGDLAEPHNRGQRIHASQPNIIHKNNKPIENRPETSEQKSDNTNSPQSSPSRNRAPTFQPSSISAPSDATTVKRPVSFPDSPSAAVTARIDATASQPTTATSAAAKTHYRRKAGSDSTGPPPSLNPRRLQAVESAQGQVPTNTSTKEWAQSQRELLLPKAIEATKPDEKKKSRPPISFRPPSLANVSANRAVIPPIRSFRSSGSRKSLVLDMHARRVSDDSSYGEDITDPNVRDRTLRALEGRGDDDYSQITPPDSANATPDNDNTADLFMKIAHEDATRRSHDESNSIARDHQTTVSRIARASHRRPLSAAVPSSQITSPPQITRRLSDQRDTSTRIHGATDGQSMQQLTRELNYRTSVKDKARPTVATEAQVVRSPLRPSPITPRQISFQDDAAQGSSAYSRRRGSLTDSNSGLPSRGSQYRSTNLTYGQGRTYNSSPLAPKVVDAHRHEGQHGPELIRGIEGTESSASTAAPSTVWDELDDMKSRIHRLELTGKAPSSAAAMSRVSDERPPTATTNATTMSASPKRTSGNGAPPADAVSTTSSQRDSQPILLSALSKTKSVIGTEAFTAIESASKDALALSSMMGSAGQPGPISSGASTIGVGGSVTDRQLRRKVESICRSLTELCLALAEEKVQPKSQQPTASTPQKEPLTSPVITRFPGLAAQRRGSALAEQSLARANTSPRTPTLEQRRFSMMPSTALPSPRYSLAAPTPTEATAVGRKSSLLISRTRRAGTEEPEEQPAGRKTSLLRTRRAATEEPEENREGRKTSFLLRNRKGLAAEEEEDTRYRVPSRATTEVNGTRLAREAPSHVPTEPTEPTSPVSSALPRRRLVPSSLNSRLIPPSAQTSLGSRRYLDRATPERDSSSVVEKLAEDRGQRQLSLSQAAMLNRTGSITRRRDSAIPNLASPSPHGGGYR